MVLEFNPDGSIIGYNTEETVNFLTRIGTQTFAEDATIRTINLGKVQCYAILDSGGHVCPCCGIKKSRLVELINEIALEKPKIVAICGDCLDTISATLLRVG